MKTVLTYGTFDLMHIGHVHMFQRLRAMADRLIVGVSTDEFNVDKKKVSLQSYEERSAIVAAIRYVDEVFPERSWDQKISDVQLHNVSIFGIGDDWAGKFDYLESYCKVVYLPRTRGISSSQLRMYIGDLFREGLSCGEGGKFDVNDVLKLLGSID